MLTNGLTAPPQFSVTSRLLAEATLLELTNASETATIHYTLDATDIMDSTVVDVPLQQFDIPEELFYPLAILEAPGS